jgi:hypothetical protein
MKIIYSVAFTLACGIAACQLDATLGEAQWYAGGYIVGFIASSIQEVTK